METLEKIVAGVKPVAQSESGATRAFKLSRDEGRIDWNQSAETVSAKIRAFTSNPGAWTNFRGAPIKIATSALSHHILNPGEISLIEKQVLIGTSTAALVISSITSVGKAQLDAAAWANGARLVAGELCE